MFRLRLVVLLIVLFLFFFGMSTGSPLCQNKDAAREALSDFLDTARLRDVEIVYEDTMNALMIQYAMDDQARIAKLLCELTVLEDFLTEHKVLLKKVD